MTTRAEWLALAEKCANAKGSERERREIAGDMAIAAGTLPSGFDIDRRGADLGEHLSFRDRFRTSYGKEWEAPDVAHSLDAIVWLIVKRWPVYSMANYGKDGAYGAIFVAPNKPVNSPKCASPALALCTAFCLAMAETCEAVDA